MDSYIDRTHPGLLAAIVICIILLGVAIVMAAVLCHKIRMSELETARSGDMVGMLAESADSNLAKVKADAMTMDIGALDDQLETDKEDARNDGNVLLDENDDDHDQPGTDEQT